MKCRSCNSHLSLADEFCRSCGLEQRNSRLPVKRAPAPPPALWHQAAPGLARGAALVVAGVAAEWLMRFAAKRALGGVLFGHSPSRGRKAISAQKSEGLPEGIMAISETVVMRRVILRR